MEPSDEDSDAHVLVQESTGIDARSLATQWAQRVLQDDRNVKEQDKPYVLATLVQAAMMEVPIKTLSVAINEHNSDYAISIKGYTGLLSGNHWYQTFRGKRRDHMLHNVSDFYIQTADTKPFVVIRVNKVKFHHTPAASAAAVAARTPGRISSGRVIVAVDNSTTPAAGRRIRKQ